MQDAQLPRSKLKSEFSQEHRFCRQKGGVSVMRWSVRKAWSLATNNPE
jgi:hypothetical protein